MMQRLPTRTALICICIAALAHAAIYIVHQRPDWETSWSDQGGYRQLGAGLATSGEFTRTPGAFVPEPIRTPGYPAFVAVVYLLFGLHNHMAVAVAQALVFVAICLFVFGIVRRIAGERAGLIGAAITAAFSPIPYFGALVLTEVWTTFLLTATVLATLHARASGRYPAFVLAGVLAAFTALTRPVFVLLPFGLFGLIALLDRFTTWKQWSAAVTAAVLCLAPWFAYNYTYFNRITVSPANGLGRAFWEASWQGVWNGRLQSELTDLAAEPTDDGELAQRVSGVAAARGLDAGPMLDYVRQWRRIRGMWADPSDRVKWAASRITADNEFYRVGIENAKKDLPDHLRRRIVRALPVLWVGEIPYRHSAINDLPVLVIRFFWAVQAAILALAAIAVAGVRVWDWRNISIVAFPFVYITAVHALLLTESRQSLPGMPSVIALSALGVSVLRRSGPRVDAHPK